MSSDTHDLRALLGRLEKVERQNRRLALAGVTALLLIVAGLLMGQVAPPRVVDADLFVVRDKDGKKRATFGRDPERGVEMGMFFYDKNGKQCVALTVPETGPGAALSLHGEGGKALALDGSWPAVALLGKDGHSRAALRLDWSDTSYLSLSNNADRVRAILTVGGSGPSHLELLDENQRTRAVLGGYEVLSPATTRVEPRPVSSLVLFDAEGKTIWSAPEPGRNPEPGALR